MKTSPPWESLDACVLSNLAANDISFDLPPDQAPISAKTTLGICITTFARLKTVLLLRQAFLTDQPQAQFCLYILDKVQNQNDYQQLQWLVTHHIAYRFVDTLVGLRDAMQFELAILRATDTQRHSFMKPFVMADALMQYPQAVKTIYLEASLDGDLRPFLNEPDSADIQLWQAGGNGAEEGFGVMVFRNRAQLLKILPFWQDAIGAALIKNELALPNLEASFFGQIQSWLPENALNQHQIVLQTSINHQAEDPIEDIEAAPTARSYYDIVPGLNQPLSEPLRKFWVYDRLFSTLNIFKPEPEILREFWRAVTTCVGSFPWFNRFSYWMWRETPLLHLGYPKIQFRYKHRKGAKKQLKHLRKTLQIERRWFMGFYPFTKMPKPVETHGLNLIGFVSLALGQGEVVRSFFRKIQPSGLPLALCDVRFSDHARISAEEQTPYQKLICHRPIYDTSFIFQNGSDLQLLKRSPLQLLKAKRNIGICWCEFESGFEDQLNGFKHVNEVLVFSDFLQGVFSKAAPSHIPVRKLPFPFIPNWQLNISTAVMRARYGIPEEGFVFFFNFDFYSSYLRKNPMGTLQAFAQGLGHRKDAYLVLKTMNGKNFPEQLKTLHAEIQVLGLEQQVILIDEAMSRDDLMSLMNATDAYISLHRGEGLGLGMLEAMWLGKPVIATGYGGNTDFMTPETACLVSHKMSPANDTYFPYRHVKFWADPNLDEASAYMQRLADSPDRGQLLGQAGQQHVQAVYDDTVFLTQFLNYLSSGG